MILRSLFIALCVGSAVAIAPVAAPRGDDDCALYLAGPGRTSAYDYTLNLLRGNFAYEGQQPCITYDDINQAYLDARKRIVVAQPKGDWAPEDFASVGELVLDISISLARRYGLTYEEIEKGLPLIDTSRTLISEVCPPVFSHVECRAGKYRRLDGLCNNLEHPTWGATNVPFQRLIGPLFADGINSPRVAHSGRDLPLSRVVSRTMHPDEGFHDHAGTVMVIAWGQFMDHDFTLTATPLDPRNRNDPEECCKRPPHQKHPYCNEIRIPDDDYFYRLFGVKCIDFVRAFPSPRPGCRLGSRIPYNTLTGAIDGNTVYGVTDKFARKLRTGYGGLLRMNDVFTEYGLKDLLPLKLDIPDEGCTRPNKDMYCFEAGEIRVNEQLVLTVMHTLMAREHNRVAKGLAAVNPHWDDETLYQEARRINIAEIQHITYNEFLPILLGKDVMEKFGLVLEKEGYWDGYDQNVNPDVIASFASAAYRFGHSLLPTAIERWSKAHKFIASKRLSDLIRRPYDLYRAGVLDEYVMGLMNQVAQAMDDSITQEVTNHLFKKVGARFGMDLVSFNMQRGREFGIPGYMEFRKFCGLPGADSFLDLLGSMPNDTVRRYGSIFEHPIDVDLWSGGVSERPLPGSMLGPTFACIIATQFSYARRGDRFWFELPNQPSSFTPEQLKEIRKSRMARVICDNTDIIDTTQLYPMVLPDHELNPRVPCRSGIIPSMDFSKWAEPRPFLGSAKQFITNATVHSKKGSHTSESANETLNKCQENNATECNDSHILAQEQNAINDTLKEKSIKLNHELLNLTKSFSTPATESDVILKYVYNKDDQHNGTQKSQGHHKNALKRKKRSNDASFTHQVPIVDYRTVHAPESHYHRDNLPLLLNYESFPPTKGLELLPLPKTSENYIKNSDLASFDIKTLHEGLAKPFKIGEETEEFQRNKQYQKKKLRNNPRLHANEESNSYNEERENASSERDQEDNEKVISRDGNRNDTRDLNSREYTQNSKETSEENRSDDRYSSSSNEHNEQGSENSSDESSKIIEPPPKYINLEEEFDKKHAESKEFVNNEENRRNNYNKENYDRKESGENTPTKYRDTRNKNYNSESQERDDENIERSPQKYKSRKPIRSDRKGYRGEFEHSDSKEDSIESKEDKPRDEREHDERNSNYEKEPYVDLPGEKYTARTPIKPDHGRYSTGSESVDSNADSIESKEDKARNESDENEKIRDSASNYRTELHDDLPHDRYTTRTPIRGDISPYSSGSESADLNEDSIERKEDKARHETDSNERPIENTRNYKKEPYIHLPKNRDSNENGGEDTESDEKSSQNKEDYRENKKKNDDHKDTANRSHSGPIQDVDLDDFSYEKIRIDKNNKVVPVADNYSDEQDRPLSSNNKDLSLRDGKKPKSHESSDYTFSEKVNNGEIKPVVEISNESESVESSKEDDVIIDRKENSNSYPNEERELEERNSEIKTPNNDGSAKQEFERIPLDYKHDKNEPKIENKEDPQENSEDDDEDESPPLPLNDESVKSPQENFDEHLAYKFNESPIQLPEIKLPDDILSYDFSVPYYEQESKKKKKANFYDPRDANYDSEDRYHDENDDDEDGEEEEERQRYKKKNNDDNEDEDLYEKFVRERFGKRESFPKRAEKLQQERYISTDPKVQAKINKILKKTEQTAKQAERSGDPKAGYLWTLEYNENL